jgi:hypothetical protein
MYAGAKASELTEANVKNVDIKIFGETFTFTATVAEADRLADHVTKSMERKKRIDAAADVLEEAGVPRSKLYPLIDSISDLCVNGMTIRPIEDADAALIRSMFEPA